MREYINVHRVNKSPAGARAEYSDEEARRLLRLGAIRLPEAEPPPAVPDDDDDPDDRQTAIRNAIEQLQDEQPEGAFTAQGKPQVSAIEDILGYDITAEERDAVWAEMSE